MSATTINTTIEAINFTRLGCHWLNPRHDTRYAENLRRGECQQRLAEFVERHRVKPFKIRYRNLQALFRQGGAGNERVKEVLRGCFGARYGMLGNYYGAGDPFDHVELWGRSGVPLVLIGHPYQITDEAQTTLAAIRGLGMVASDYHPSWYGMGTVQVRVYHPPTLNALTERARGERAEESALGLEVKGSASQGYNATQATQV